MYPRYASSLGGSIPVAPRPDRTHITVRRALTQSILLRPAALDAARALLGCLGVDLLSLVAVLART